MEIKFSRTLTSINLKFATIDYHGPGNVETPSDLKLTASLETTTVGSTTTRGTYINTYPEGTISFASSSAPFNIVRLELPYSPQGATSFLIDNIAIVTT